MMDKNIAALLREDARTVQVVFGNEGEDVELEDPNPIAQSTLARRRGKTPYGAKFSVRTYTYVTDLDLKEGDTVLVEASGSNKVVSVYHVDREVKIEPNCETQYKWVICRVDFSHHAENIARNREIERLVAEAYRTNMRRSFSQQILSGLEGERLLEVSKLLRKGPD